MTTLIRDLSRRNFRGLSAALGAAALSSDYAYGSSTESSGGAVDNVSLIRALYDAVNSKDLAVIESYGANDSEWLDVPFKFTSKGKRAIIDPWKSWFDIFPDATCEVRSVVGLGDHVVAQGTGRGTHRGLFKSPAGELPPTGRKMAVSFCDVYQMQNGRILRADSYFDFYDLLAQLKA
jgi:predicted ester cyclase